MPRRAMSPVRTLGTAKAANCREFAAEGLTEIADPEPAPATADVEPDPAVATRLPDSTSRFNRFRSPRRSAADW